MGHWSEKYIGKPYIPGVADCMNLAEQVANEVLGIYPNIPVSHETSLRGQAEQLSRLKADFAVRVDKPIDAQPVLFVARGRFFHCGVVALIGSETWVLHNDQSAGMVVCQRLRDMTRWAYSFEGFYKWLATN
ncbi:hypothetical protein ABRZ04_04565 [Castellaniella ginsengisoli]|uniref:NlpC/P60 domain-containing protein n=1 Tax=Castellaniella ginsengisoli TaxID=546114 RepID=A0AB39D0J5_9BURK